MRQLDILRIDKCCVRIRGCYLLAYGLSTVSKKEKATRNTMQNLKVRIDTADIITQAISTNNTLHPTPRITTKEHSHGISYGITHNNRVAKSGCSHITTRGNTTRIAFGTAQTYTKLLNLFDIRGSLSAQLVELQGEHPDRCCRSICLGAIEGYIGEQHLLIINKTLLILISLRI